jgi:very-short-patch-repair endonuclease
MAQIAFIAKIKFIHECIECEKDYDSLEILFAEELNICLICFEKALMETDCKKTQKKLCNNLSCKLCYNRSLASRYTSRYWAENDKTCREICATIHLKLFNVKCPICSTISEQKPQVINCGKWCHDCYPKVTDHNSYVDICVKKEYDLPVDRKNNIYKTTRLKLYHKCEVNEHKEYPQTPASHVQGQGCPECAGNQLKTHKKYISDCIKKGYDLPVERYNNKYFDSKKKLYHKCKVLEHVEYPQTPNGHLMGNGCPLCGIEQNRIKNARNHDVYVEICKILGLDLPEADDNNKYYNGNTKLFHKCAILEHKEYLHQPTLHLRGYIGCKECINISIIERQTKTHQQYIDECKKLDLDLPIIKSYNIYKHIKIKLLHKCQKNEKHKEYSQRPDCHLLGQGCPQCKNKSEAKFYELLIEKNIVCETQINFDWCKNEVTNKYFPFDFLIKTFRIILELDGMQHFRDITYWHTNSLKQCSRDCYKMQQAIKNKYTIIRILQPEFYKNPKEIINMVLPYIKQYDKPEIIYITKNISIYDRHKSIMNIQEILTN